MIKIDEIKIIDQPNLPHSNPLVEIPRLINSSDHIYEQGLYEGIFSRCKGCGEMKNDSEYQISCKCNSIKTICLECLSKSIFKCLICNEKYPNEIIAALELYKLSKPNIN